MFCSPVRLEATGSGESNCQLSGPTYGYRIEYYKHIDGIKACQFKNAGTASVRLAITQIVGYLSTAPIVAKTACARFRGTRSGFSVAALWPPAEDPCQQKE
jgi:hypothetical protein